MIGFWKMWLKRRIPGYLSIICLVLGVFYELASGQKMENVHIGKAALSDTLYISLQEAIFTGLKNNPTVTIQRLEPEIMKTYVKEQKGVFDPTLGIIGQQSQNKSQRLLGTRPTPVELQDNRSNYSAQISEILPTGTTVLASTGMAGALSNLYTDQFTGSIGITITQPLLKGFGFGANLASLRKAKIDVDISQSELKGFVESIIADIETSYWELYLTGKEMTIQKNSLELAERQLSESLERVKVGKLPELELAAVEAEVAVRKSALIDVQSRHEQVNLRFLYLLNPGNELSWSRQLRPTDEPFLPKDTLAAVNVHEQIGLKYRSDLEQARLNLQKGDLEIRRTRNGLLPQLDFFITLGKTTYAKSFDKAYPDVNSPYYQASAGLTLEIPAANQTALAQHTRTRLSREQQSLAFQNMEKLAQVEIRSAYTEVFRARQQIEATRMTRELQEKKLAAELEKFRVGKSTNILVLQAQNDFIASQLNEARTMVAYLNALVSLYVSEGALLERRGIETL